MITKDIFIFKKIKLKAVLYMILSSLLIFLLYIIFFNVEHVFSSFLIFVLFLILVSFFMLKKHLILFEPIVLFSAYYFTVVLAGLYFLSTNFENNSIIESSVFYNKISTLFNLALIYLIIGYVSTLIGYYTFRRSVDKLKNIKYESISLISNNVLKLTIILLVSIGILNFLYNIYNISGGSIIKYFKNVGVRGEEMSLYGGTTVGYIFTYLGMFVWSYYIFRNKSRSFLFLSFLIISISMMFSTGRIISTIMFFSNFIFIYYFVQLCETKKIKNRRYYLLALFIMLFGISFYFYRIVSNHQYQDLLITDANSAFWRFFSFEKIGYFAFDRGNVPNIPVLMKIIDSWNNDIGFLYGQTFFTWFFDFIPSGIRPEGLHPAAIIKETWYSHITGGNLPPTGVGEMYANFGIVGPIIGMFLFGAFSAGIFNLFLRSKNFWILLIVSQISINFIAFYPKGELYNLSLWLVLPVLFIYLFLRFFTYYLQNIQTKRI